MTTSVTGFPAGPTAAAPLAAEGLTLGHSGHVVASGLALEFRAGEFTVLIGPNGAGKSTTLSALAGDLRPRRGCVRLEGKCLSRWTARERSKRRAVLPQHAALTFGLSVHEVVQLGRAPFGEAPAFSEQVAMAALEAVELEASAELSYLTLSGGERQRVQLARVLAQVWPGARAAASTILLDEPVASLDPRQQHRALALLRALARRGVTVVAVLHDLALAAAYADRVMVLKAGELVADGPPVETLSAALLERVFETPFEVDVSKDGAVRIAPRLDHVTATVDFATVDAGR